MKFYRLIFISLSCFIAASGAEQEEELNIEIPEPKTPGLDIHGVLDVSVKNDYITPRGLLVTNTGVTIQVLSILSFDVYANPKGWLNKATLFVGAWNDIWTKQDNPTVGAWNELDWFAGVNFTFARNWKFGVQFLAFLSPPGNFKAEDNIEFILAYDDSSSGYPIAFNPYVKFFWALSGSSTIVTGKPGGTFDIEIGAIPTYNLSKQIALKAPTWITVGPASFWNGGDLGLKHEKKNFGVFSTGLRGDLQLAFIPSRFGRWNFYVGAQYYYLINKNLVHAQETTLKPVSHRFGYRNVYVGYAGIGMEY